MASATKSTKRQSKFLPSKRFEPTLVGLSELIEIGAKVLGLYDQMRVEHNEEVDNRRKQVKDRAGQIFASDKLDEEFCSHTIGICIKMLGVAEESIMNLLDSAEEDFAESVLEINKQSPTKQQRIADELAAHQARFRALDENSSIEERVMAYAAVNNLLIDTLDAIDREEEDRLRQEAIAKGTKNLKKF